MLTELTSALDACPAHCLRRLDRRLCDVLPCGVKANSAVMVADALAVVRDLS